MGQPKVSMDSLTNQLLDKDLDEMERQTAEREAEQAARYHYRTAWQTAYWRGLVTFTEWVESFDKEHQVAERAAEQQANLTEVKL